MIKSIEVTAKTEEEAINSALRQLGKERDEVSVELLERAKSGFLGLGGSPALVRVSYSYEESKTETVRKFLDGLLQRMGMEAEASVTADENGDIGVELKGNDIGALIGRRGETLDAVQHIVNYVVNKGEGHRTRITVDAENYRAKRAEALSRLGEKVAAKVVKYRRNLTLEPMNAYERHVIHTALQDMAFVTTYSTGTEPNRRVVVAYDRQKMSSKPAADKPAQMETGHSEESARATAAEIRKANETTKYTSREWS